MNNESFLLVDSSTDLVTFENHILYNFEKEEQPRTTKKLRTLRTLIKKKNYIHQIKQ